jgi:hypothetical protein
MKIYYNISSDNYYTFKFFFQDILVVSGIKPNNKVGNKRKSGKIEIIFMNSYLHNSTGETSREPELNLWDEYLESFSISKEMLIRWLDRYIKYGDYYSRFLERIKNKIKDKQL